MLRPRIFRLVPLLKIILLLIFSAEYVYAAYYGEGADFNNDGYDDLAVSVPGEWVNNAESGWIAVYHGSKNGLVFAQDLNQSPFGKSHDNSESGDNFGYSTAIGNYNCDDYDDLVVGIPGEEYNDIQAGWVMVFKGGPKGLTAAQSLHQWDNEISGDNFGSAIVLADLNGDHCDEIIIGAPGKHVDSKKKKNIKAGAVYIFQGGASGAKPGRKLFQPEEWPVFDARYGAALTRGDFNNDGLDDVAVGAPHDQLSTGERPGWVYVYGGDREMFWLNLGFIKISWPFPLGNKHPSWHFGQSSLGSNEDSDFFGSALAAGDFNGDDFDDLAVGAPGENLGKIDSGIVYIFKGSNNGLKAAISITQKDIDKNEDGDNFGSSLSVGNFNKDFYADLAIGSPGEVITTPQQKERYSGMVYVFKGDRTKWLSADYRLHRYPPEDSTFGASLSVGNFEGRSPQGLAVGLPNYQGGAVFIYNNVDRLRIKQVLSQTQPELNASNEPGDSFGLALPGSPAYKRRILIEIDTMKGISHLAKMVKEGEHPNHSTSKFEPSASLQSLFYDAGIVLELHNDVKNKIPYRKHIRLEEMNLLARQSRDENLAASGDRWSLWCGILTRIDLKQSAIGLNGTTSVRFSEKVGTNTYKLWPRGNCLIFEDTMKQHNVGSYLDEQKMKSLTHELGHTLGLHHDDWGGTGFTPRDNPPMSTHRGTIMSYSHPPNSYYRFSRKSKNHLQHHPLPHVRPGLGSLKLDSMLDHHEKQHRATN